MIPLVGFKKELDLQVAVVRAAAKAVMAEQKVKLNYMVGTMIEVPRGALTADEIAQTAEFFSFGTNDLTQTCLGMSRDDSGSFLPPYAELEICKTNPFASIDQAGVGQLMKIAVEKGNKGRPGIKLGICGEHGGDPNSVKFCHKLGLTYVSCSPFRVPVARLAAAQAALEEEAAKAMADKGRTVKYTIGTMIELPRACVAAGRIAAGPEGAEFFSFGTNDLTQTCLGMSRDDSGSFLPPYAELEICKTNPFASIDQAGVGQLMQIAVEKGNKSRPGIKLGICGEHGGDPNSVKFCHKIGLTYVSCSPFRVPVARLAAAQAAIEEKRKAAATKKK